MDAHYRRTGNKPGATNALTYNANAAAHGPWSLSDMESPAADYVGYDLGGRWREGGVQTSEALRTEFGNSVHALDSSKWTIAASGAVVQAAPGWLKISLAGANESTFLVAASDAAGVKWRILSGAFDLTLDVAATLPAGAGVAPALQNQVYVEIKSESTGNVARAKLCRTDSGSSRFAAFVTGVGDLLGDTATASTVIRLGVSRDDAGIVTLTAHGQTPDTAFATLTAVAMPGDVTVEVGVLSTVVTPWVAYLYRLGVGSGRHTWSPLASWAREAREGQILDTFDGSGLGPAWTSAVTGAGTVAVADGLTLASPGIGTASVAHPAISGDFVVRIGVDWARAEAHDQPVLPAGGTTWQNADIAWSVDIEPEQYEYPRYRTAVKYYRDGAGTYWTLAQIESWTAAGAATVIAYADALPTSTDAMRYIVTIEKIGDYLSISMLDVFAQVVTVSTEIAGVTVPTTPWKPTLHVAGSTGAAATVSATFTKYHLTGSGSVAASGLPASLYAISASANDDEVQQYTLTDSSKETPQAAEVTLVGLDQVLGLSVVGLSRESPSLEFDQAVPAGAISTVWMSPAGRLWIPVTRSANATTGGFICIDFKADRIYRYRSGTLETFDGPIAHRNIGHGYTMTDATAADAPGAGDPVARFRGAGVRLVAGGEQYVSVWVTALACKVYSETPVTSVSVFAGAAIRSAVFVDAATPSGSDTKATIVLAVARGGDEAVVIYRDPTSLSTEAFAGEDADAIYTGSSPDGANGDMVGGKIVGAASGAQISDLDAVRRVDGYVAFAVARSALGASLTEDSATPTAAAFSFWGPVNPQPGADPGRAVSYSPVGVRLTADATLSTGYLCLSTASAVSITGGGTDNAGTVDVIALAATDKGVRYRATPGSADSSLVTSSDRRSTPAGLAILPPVDGSGIRAAWGTSASMIQAAGVGSTSGALEYTVLATFGGPWTSPHYGGTKVAITGRGLDGVKSVSVGGVDAAVIRSANESLSGVVRSLGFILTGEPAVSDQAIEGGGPWAYDVVISWSDGGTMTIASGLSYTAGGDVEALLFRLLSRLPERVLEPWAKGDTYQRHILLSVAASLYGFGAVTLPRLEADTYIDESTGGELIGLCSDYAAAAAGALALTDAQSRSYVRASAFGSRITAKAIRDLVEAALSVRPTIEEGYKSLTVIIPLAEQDTASYWSDVTGAGTSYMTESYWSGEDPRIAAITDAIKSHMVAGVSLTVRIQEP